MTVQTRDVALPVAVRRLRARQAAATIPVVAALLAFPLVAPTYAQSVVIEVMVFAIFAMSLDLLLGYTGLASFGHAAFYGLGAYAAGLAARHLSDHLLVGLLIGLLVAGLGALLIGALAIRSLGVYFLMLTLAFSQMIYAAAFKWMDVTGGSNGLAGIPRPRLDLPGLPGPDFGSAAQFYYLALAAFLGSYLVLRRVVRSPFGRTLVGIRENEVRMRAIGYDVWRYKLAAFVLAGLFAGLAGVLHAYYNGFVSPSDVYWTTSGLVMIMVIIGGAGTLIGPVLGAALVLVLQDVVSTATERWPLIMGLIFMFFVVAARGGIVGLYETLARGLRGGGWKS